MWCVIMIYVQVGLKKPLYYRRVFVVCLQIDSECYEWGLSARSVGLNMLK